jgi:tRNA (guanine-N7-)-methyltransferase
MRDEFEQYAGDILHLSPLHATPGAMFHWTPDQEAAAAAASALPSDVARRQQQQQQQQQQHSVSSSEAGDSSCSSSADHHEDDAEEDSELHSEDYASETSSDKRFVSSWAAGGWLVDNPLGVPTEREHYVQAQGGKVFRVLLVKQ